jgi:hypothetical protein
MFLRAPEKKTPSSFPLRSPHFGLYDTQAISLHDGLLGSYYVQCDEIASAFRRKLLPPVLGWPNLDQVDAKADVPNSVHSFFKKLKEY